MKAREIARIRVVKTRRAAKRLRFRRRRGSFIDLKTLRGAKGALRKSSEEKEEPL